LCIFAALFANILLAACLSVLFSSSISALEFDDVFSEAIKNEKFLSTGMKNLQIVCGAVALVSGALWVTLSTQTSFTLFKFCKLIFTLFSLFSAYAAFIYILATDDDRDGKFFAAFQFVWIVILFVIYRKRENIIPLGGASDNIFARIADACVLLAPVFGVTFFFAFVHERRIAAGKDSDVFKAIDISTCAVMTILLPTLTRWLSALRVYYERSLINAFFPERRAIRLDIEVNR